MPTVNKTAKPAPWKPKRKPFQRATWKRNRHIYDDPRWRRESKAFKYDNPLCVLCLDKGLAMDSKVTDHILPINEGGRVWDHSNWQALCKVCHDAKSRVESKRAMKGGGLHP